MVITVNNEQAEQLYRMIVIGAKVFDIKDPPQAKMRNAFCTSDMESNLLLIFKALEMCGGQIGQSKVGLCTLFAIIHPQLAQLVADFCTHSLGIPANFNDKPNNTTTTKNNDEIFLD